MARARIIAGTSLKNKKAKASKLIISMLGLNLIVSIAILLKLFGVL